MKKSKILIPALAMLVMSTAATVTGTVAWFSANSTVTATGMKVKASTNENLLIGKSSTTNTVDPSIGKLSDGKSTQSFASATKELNPTSTVDGSNWFTANAAESDSYAAVANGYAAVSESDKDKYRLETTMYLQVYDYTKTVGSAVSGKKIYLDYVNITFASGDLLNTSFRVLVTCATASTKVFVGPTSSTTPTNEGVASVVAGAATLQELTFATGAYNGTDKKFTTASNNVVVAAPTYQTVYEVKVACYFDGEDEDNMTDNIPNTLGDYEVGVGYTIRA